MSALLPLKKLWWLAIKLGGTKDLGLLPSVGKLKYLELWRILGLDDIAPIGQVEALQCLFMQSLKRVTRLPSFQALKNLRTLYIEQLRGLHDLSPIAGATSLEVLALIDMSNIGLDELVPLKGMPSLRAVNIGLGSIKRNQKAQQLFNLPTSSNIITGFQFR